MKILKVIHGYPPTYNAGSEVYSKSICESLAEKHEVKVFTREQNEYQLDFAVRKEIRNGIPITLINLAREKDGYEHAQVNEAFRKVLLQFQPDIVHVGHLNHLSLGIITEAKKQSIPIVYTLHDFWLMCPRGQFLQRNFDGENLYRLCTKQEDNKCAVSCYKMIHSCQSKDGKVDTAYWTDWIARRMEAVRNIVDKVDLFIAPSRYLMNRYVSDFRLPKDKVVYLDYGFPTQYLKPIEHRVNRPFTFGYIGTHIPSKGVNLLIEAFKQVKGNAQLKIWGRHIGQNTASLHRLAEGSLNPIVFKQEYQNENILEEVFSQTDTIVVPSIWGENSPLVIHEAQACHVPVITADFGGMKEYVHHHINGLLFEHRSVESLATQMQYAIDHSSEMRAFGKRGYLYSDDGTVPCIKEHCKQLIQLYQQIIKTYEPAK